MGAKSGRDGTPLSEGLYQRPTRFQFFQAVRLLRKLSPDRAGVGRDSDPEDEHVRFRSDMSYAFPTGDVRSLSRPEPADEEESGASSARREPDDMVVNFMGIATPNSFGSLPMPYVEEIRFQERNRNSAMRDFLDLFNHRLISLFYRAWERTRPDVLYDLGEKSPFEAALRAVIGIEGEVQRSRVPFDDRRILSRAGLIAMRPCSTTALEGLVTSLFGVPARVEQFLPCWYATDETDQSRLGVANSMLGDSLCLGSEVCLNQSRFRLRLGPMDFDSYRSLLPEGDAFDTLCSLVRMATSVEFDFEVTLVLDRQAVPRLQLADEKGEEHNPCRLGWSTWLERRNFATDADHAVFTPSLAREEARDSMETRP